MKKRVLLVTEYLDPPYDEGIKKTVYNLFLHLEKKYTLKVICRFGFEKENVMIVDTNRLYLSRDIRLLIKDFAPDTLLYFPFQSSTFASYIRLKVLSIFSKKSKIGFFALQPKPIKKWQQFVVKFIKPKHALTPSPALSLLWDKMKINNILVPLLTDLSIFEPINNVEMLAELRKKYDLPVDRFIVSHMGHLNEGRNLKSLIPLQRQGVQIVIISSSSTPKDAIGHQNIKNELLNAGIIIKEGYVEHIEEIYQLSNAYIFPVVRKNSSIGMPLSVLEARACGIQVITTDYGSLKHFLGDDFQNIYYATPNEFLDCVERIQKESKKDVKRTKVSLLNEEFYKTIYKLIEE